MIIKKELEKLIIGLNEELLDYAGRFHIEKNDLSRMTLDTPKLSNERTLAAFSNNYLEEQFVNKGFECFVVHEFSIKLSKTKTEEFQSALAKELKKVRLDKQLWSNCSIDGYFKVNNLFFLGVNHIFVEYKMRQSNLFIHLANDYLKYKIYTAGTTNNSIFAFVIIEKDELMPSIILSATPKYIRINKSTDFSKIGKSNVYIYVDKPYRMTSKAMVLQYYFDKLSNLSIEYRAAIDEMDGVDFSEHAVVQGAKILHQKVIRSMTIKQNIPFIFDLWKKASELLIFEKNHSDFLAMSEADRIDLIKAGGVYFANFETHFGIGDKIDAMNKGLNVSYEKSLNIVVLLDFFATKFEIETDKKPYYYSTSVGRGSNKQTVKKEEFAKSQKEKFSNIYAEDGEKIKGLAFSLLYYIINYYKYYFEINDQNEVIGERPVTKIETLKASMESTMKEIFKLLDYKDKFKIDSSTDEENFEKLFNYILSEKWLNN